MNSGRILGLIWILCLCGCAGSSHLLTGTPRPAISPDEVTVFTQAPARYEEIAVLDASSRGGFKFTDQGRMDKVVQRLKVEAAKLGANGVLLQSTQNQVSGGIGTGGGSTSFGNHSAVGVGGGIDLALVSKEAHGIAIFVPMP